MEKNKKGQMNTMMILGFIFICFFAIIFLGVLLYLGLTVDSVMSGINIKVGNINFNESYNQTMAPALNKLISNADYSGIGLLFGMIIVMLICGYKFRTSKRLFILIDLLIIVVCFIISVVIQNYYNYIININADLYNIYTNYLPKSSTFILRLPIIISIIGVLILIVSYATINKKKSINIYGEEEDV
jgi:hypothetical protein